MKLLVILKNFIFLNDIDLKLKQNLINFFLFIQIIYNSILIFDKFYYKIKY